MRSCVRFSFLALLVGVLVAAAAPAAQAAFGVEKFFGRTARRLRTLRKNRRPNGRCRKSNRTTEAEGFTQAGGHPTVRHHRLHAQHDSGSEAAAVPTGVRDARQDRCRSRVLHQPGGRARSAQCAEFGTTKRSRQRRVLRAHRAPDCVGKHGDRHEQRQIFPALAEAGHRRSTGTVYNLVTGPKASRRCSVSRSNARAESRAHQSLYRSHAHRRQRRMGEPTTTTTSKSRSRPNCP